MEFTKRQPKQGEKVLHCGHFDVLPQHFYEMLNNDNTGPAVYTRADGSEMIVHWLILCEKCLMEHPTDPINAARVECEWEVEEPIITQYVRN